MEDEPAVQASCPILKINAVPSQIRNWLQTLNKVSSLTCPSSFADPGEKSGIA